MAMLSHILYFVAFSTPEPGNSLAVSSSRVLDIHIDSGI
jgi:hypothetical protein